MSLSERMSSSHCHKPTKSFVILILLMLCIRSEASSSTDIKCNKNLHMAP